MFRGDFVYKSCTFKLIMLFFSVSSFAATYEMNPADFEQIAILHTEDATHQGAQFTFTQNHKLSKVKISTDDGVKVVIANSPKGIKRLLVEPVGKTKVDIQSPVAIESDIHGKDFFLNVHTWNKSFHISGQKIKLSLIDVSGGTHISAQRLDLNANDSSGKLDIDTYSGSVTIKRWNGDIDLHNFSGDSLIDHADGALNLSSFQGAVRVTAGSGSLQVENFKGNSSEQNFLGRVEAQSTEGNISVVCPTTENSDKDSDLSLKSQSGRIVVDLPKVGAKLNVATQEGDLVLPNAYKPIKQGRGKSFKGYVHGEGEKAVVFVRNQSGSVLIK